MPNVVFVDPNYTDAAEDNGTSNDYHPKGSVLVAEQFVARVHDALKDSPQWARMVFVLNFDEHGGFFDHVPPPACRDDTVQIGAGPFPDLKRLGFRVPAIAMRRTLPTRSISRHGARRSRCPSLRRRTLWFAEVSLPQFSTLAPRPRHKGWGDWSCRVGPALQRECGNDVWSLGCLL